MNTTTSTVSSVGTVAADRHPKGLYVLFATEMWERFGFYSMLAMFTLYMQNAEQGFGWTVARATSVYSNYLMFVYASPLVGGWIADRFTGYRRAITLGAIFFATGYFLLSVRSVPLMYVSLALLVIGNGFFKPNVSAMVGSLYPEGSRLKDSAYNIFYMGINVGAFTAPIVAESMMQRFGFHPAFAVAGVGMGLCLLIFHGFAKHIVPIQKEPSNSSSPAAEKPAEKVHPIDLVPDSRRIMALIVIFLIVIVFWMVFHQNGSTLTYWANNNTEWTAAPAVLHIASVLTLGTVKPDVGNVSGVISNAINPFWIIVLTFPLIAFWQWLGRRGREPSTPTKIAIGMFLTAVSFYIMSFAALSGGDIGRVSPWWLIIAYGVISLGELMLSPMGLSLVSKVAPARMRGLMMGGWFVATAIGNKLTAIGVYWEVWRHSTFFFILATMALIMAGVLLLLLRPLKRAMPGV
ncbi:MAG: peptide MFS transporter [Acidobacteriota bacterium]